MLAGISKHIPVQVFIKDIDEHYPLVSKLSETITSLSNAELQGKTFYHLVNDPAIADKLQANIYKLTEEGKSVQFEKAIPFEDGIHTLHSVQFPLFDENRKVYAMCGMSFDVTKSRKLEVEQWEQDQHYRILSELVSDYALVNEILEDGSFHTVFSSGSFERITGYIISDLTYLTEINKIYHPDDYDRVWDDYHRMLEGESFQTEYRIIRQNGVQGWIEVSQKPIWSKAHNRVVRYYMVMRDITERKHAEAALKEREQQYRALFEHNNDGIFLFDLDFNVIGANERVSELWGYTHAEILTHEFPMYVADEERLNAWDVAQRLLKGEQFPIYERKIQHKEGHPIHVQSIVQDITKRKRREQFIERVTGIAPARIYVFDLQEMCNIYSNQAVHTILGYSPDAITAMGDHVMHPDDTMVVRQHLEELVYMENSDVLDMVYRLRGATGQWHWIKSYETVFERNDAGELTQYIGVALDITDQMEAEESRRRSERQYRILTQNFPNGIVAMFDTSSRYTFAEGRGFEQFGIKKKELIGKGLGGILPSKSYDDEEVILRRTLLGESTESLMTVDSSSYRILTVPLADEMDSI